MYADGSSVSMVDPDTLLDALTGRMTGAEVAERLQQPTSEVVPLLAQLHHEGLVGRLVDDKSIARFMPLAGASVHQLPSPQPLAAVA